MNTPTWSDLARLLNSDPASDKWATEARLELDRTSSEFDDLWNLVDFASDDVQDALLMMEQDSMRPEIIMTEADELKRLASVAKCGAVKFLIAAFAAEQALGKLEGAT